MAGPSEAGGTARMDDHLNTVERLQAPMRLSAGERTAQRIVPTATPTLSWQLPHGTLSQTGWQLEAISDDEALEAAHRGAEHTGVAWPWSAVSSRSRTRWRVRVQDQDDRWSAWSDWTTFEAPLFSPTDWQARWISPEEEDVVPTDRAAHVLRRDLVVDSPVRSARLYATALGLYEAFVDGTRVGDHELTPGSSNYDKTLYAQAYDVTDLVHEGENCLEIVLSDGWYRGRNGGMQRQNCWGSTTAVLAQLEIELEDGDLILVVTDARWQTATSAIVRADLMTGQSTRFDTPARLVGGVRVEAATGPVPTWSPAPPVHRIEELAPVTATEITAGVTVLDFGQNLSGWVRLTDLGPAGSETEIEFAEHLGSTGDIDTAHLDIHTPDGRHLPYRQIDRVTAGPLGDVFEPRHTVHGFRYARLTHPGRLLASDAVTAVVVHTDLDPTGEFACSDTELNALHDAVRWSFRGNAVDVPTDCPTRERSGWTGDYQVFSATANVLYDVAGFTTKWLQAVRDDQYDDGSLAMFSPDSERMKHSDDSGRMGGGSAGWGDAAVIVPWSSYLQSGETAILAESWSSMEAWVTFALAAAAEQRHPLRVARSAEPLEHEQFIWDGTFHFGEWLEPTSGTEPTDPAAAYAAFLSADNGEIATAYLHHSTLLISDAARALGRHQDADRYADLAHKVRAAWQHEFLSPAGRTATDTQASYVRALAFDLVPKSLREAAATRLVALITEAGMHLSTGFLSTGMLLPALADTGRVTTAYDLLLQHGSPSWLGMLDRGATTMWEEWEGVDTHGNAKASLNHYSKGAAVSFLYSHVAGLRQAADSRGWDSYEIRPVLGGGLTWAWAALDTPNGLIRTAWHTDDATFHLDAVVPAGAEATATLPDGTTARLIPGEHHLSCTLPPASRPLTPAAERRHDENEDQK